MLTEQQIQKIWEKNLTEVAKLAKKNGFPNIETPEEKAGFSNELEDLDAHYRLFEMGLPDLGIPEGNKNTLKNKIISILVNNMLVGTMDLHLIPAKYKSKSPHKYKNDPKGELISLDARDHFVNRILLESSQYYKKLKPTDIFNNKLEIISFNFYIVLSKLFTCLESLSQLGDSNLNKRFEFLFMISWVNTRNTFVHWSKLDLPDSKREEMINMNKLSSEFTDSDNPYSLNKQVLERSLGVLSEWLDMAKTIERMKYGYDDIHIWDILVDPAGLIDKIKIKQKENPKNILRSLFGLK